MNPVLDFYNFIPSPVSSLTGTNVIISNQIVEAGGGRGQQPRKLKNRLKEQVRDAQIMDYEETDKER